MTSSSAAGATGGFMPFGEDSDDLPRTFRREKEARAREARERAAAERAAAPSLPIGDAQPAGPQTSPSLSVAPQAAPAADVQPVVGELPFPASVRRFDVPFLHMVTFFLKAVVAAVPALFLLMAILWAMGSVVEAMFPELIKMKILIGFQG